MIQFPTPLPPRVKNTTHQPNCTATSFFQCVLLSLYCCFLVVYLSVLLGLVWSFVTWNVVPSQWWFKTMNESICQLRVIHLGTSHTLHWHNHKVYCFTIWIEKQWLVKLDIMSDCLRQESVGREPHNMERWITIIGCNVVDSLGIVICLWTLNLKRVTNVERIWNVVVSRNSCERRWDDVAVGRVTMMYVDM